MFHLWWSTAWPLRATTVSCASLPLKLSKSWRRFSYSIQFWRILMFSMCRNWLASPLQSYSPTSPFTGSLTRSAQSQTRRLPMKKRLSSEKGGKCNWFMTVMNHTSKKNPSWPSKPLYDPCFVFSIFQQIWHTCTFRWECISSESSRLLLSQIQPKLVLSGFQWFLNSCLFYFMTSFFRTYTPWL